MLDFKRKIILDIFKAFDIFLVFICLLVSASWEHLTNGLSELAEVLAMRISLRNGIILLGFAFICHIIFSKFGLYNSRRISRFRKELFDIVQAVTLVFMILLLATFLYPMQIIDKKALQIFWILGLLSFIASRIGLRTFLRMVRKKKRNLRRILIIGTNARAIALAETFTKNSSTGYLIEGFVDTVWHGPACTNKENFKLVSDFKHFQEYIRRHIIDEIFIMLPIKSCYEKIESIVRISEEQGIVIRMQTDFMDLHLARSQVEYVQDVPLLTMYTGTMHVSSFGIMVKSFVDFIVAGILLVVLFPFFAAIAILIKVTSKGPVFFRQERVGLNKRIFKIFKFRTMALDAEERQKDLERLNDLGEDSGAFKLKNDPRVTPFGAILRKLSLDEFPQLLNVFLGDMSLVGPRPLTMRDYHKFKTDWQRRRFSVKPGITCLWQVSGRSTISFDRWMELDMEYIDQWSIGLDFQILFKTIPAVLFGKGAV